MSMPGFTAEVSLYRTNGRYRGLTAAPAHGLGVQMAQSPLNRLSTTSRLRVAQNPSLTCYLDGFETSCDVVFACLRIGACELVSPPISLPVIF